VSRSDLTSLARFTELHTLVRTQETHKLRHLDNFNGASKVDIKVAPSFLEVRVKILL